MALKPPFDTVISLSAEIRKPSLPRARGMKGQRPDCLNSEKVYCNGTALSVSFKY